MSKFQLVNRLKSHLLPNGPSLRRLPFGPFRGQIMEIDFASQSQYFLGLWERETYPYITPAFEGAQWLVDAGSQQGEYVIAMLRKPQAERVWAFDPDPASNEKLRRNLAANGLEGDQRLSVSETFLGAKTSENCVAIDVFLEFRPFGPWPN